MADGDEVTPQAGELTTVNYGWVKPNVGNSDDAWGGFLNADLDSIDTTVKSVSTVANAAYPASNPSGYQTAAQVATALTTYPVNDNRIINGDFRIDQRNNGASGTANGYTVDRWQYAGSQASKLTWQRATGPANLGFPYALWLTSSSAYTPLAADSFFINQAIEADTVSDLAWGTASAQPVTLSFWMLATVAGAYSGAIVNQPAPPTRCYPFSFSLASGAWTKVVITIPGDTGGTWVTSGNAGGLAVKIDVGSGSTFRAAAGAWVNGNFNGVTGATSLIATNGAAIAVTGVKLEIGSIATPYNRQSLAKSLTDCARYYLAIPQALVGGYAVASGVVWAALPILMRTTPTAVFSGFVYGGAGGASSIALDSASSNVVNLRVTITATGTGWGQGAVALSAEL